MSFIGRFRSGPYMGSPRSLNNPRPDLLRQTTYQVVSSDRGLPMVQLGLTFHRQVPACSNPDMSLALLIDRSGSMSEAFSSGHVFNACAAVLRHVQQAGVGFDLAFYDDEASYAGRIRTEQDLNAAIQQNPARGGTYVTRALDGVIQKYRKRKGIYVIVVTDGEFADKKQVQKLVVDRLLPQLTPENPYAFRLHFVGAGEGVDREFLEQLEAAAVGQGIALVTQHHHAHLSHSHNSILDELDRAFMGVGTELKAQEQTPQGGEGVITRVGDVTTRRWQDGSSGSLGFLPRRSLLGFEFKSPHPPIAEIGISYQDPQQQGQELTFRPPLPRDTVSTAGKAVGGSGGWHWPWQNLSPEEEAARAAAAQQRAMLIQQAEADRQSSLKRQSEDLVSLSRGGIPAEARERLLELGEEAEAAGALFTSNLAPDEAALLRRHGYRLRGVVSGSAMYHVGQAYASAQGDCEVKVLSEAYDTATQLAVSRMEQELRLIRAHGVVGVRLSMVRHEWGEKTVEVQVIGTAVEGPGAPPAEPWLSDLSGQEWWALHRAGYEPVGLVWGHCTWFILTTQSDEYIKTTWSNQELTHWSQALGAARRRALNHAHQQAKDHHATGIVGVRFERRLDEVRLTGPGADPAYEREHHNLVVSIVGTAVRLRQDAPRSVPQTLQVLSLRDGRMTPAIMHDADAKFE